MDIDKMIDEWKKKMDGVALQIQFIGIDSWNRPIFKALDRENFFIGDNMHLFDYGATEDEVLKFYEDLELSKYLTYFGTHFGCEPWGLTLETASIELIRNEN